MRRAAVAVAGRGRGGACFALVVAPPCCPARASRRVFVGLVLLCRARRRRNVQVLSSVGASQARAPRWRRTVRGVSRFSLSLLLFLLLFLLYIKNTTDRSEWHACRKSDDVGVRVRVGGWADHCQAADCRLPPDVRRVRVLCRAEILRRAFVDIYSGPAHGLAGRVADRLKKDQDQDRTDQVGGPVGQEGRCARSSILGARGGCAHCQSVIISTVGSSLWG